MPHSHKPISLLLGSDPPLPPRSHPQDVNPVPYSLLTEIVETQPCSQDLSSTLPLEIEKGSEQERPWE